MCLQLPSSLQSFIIIYVEFSKNKSPCKFSPTATAQAPRAQSPHLAAGNSKTGSAHPHSQQQGPCRGHGGSAPQSHVVHVKAFICLCWSMLVHAGLCWSMLVPNLPNQSAPEEKWRKTKLRFYMFLLVCGHATFCS